MGLGIVLLGVDGVEIGQISKAMGNGTNNQAEYLAAIEAAAVALDWGVRDFTLMTDSELMHRQLKGVYRVKNPGIKKLYDQLKSILREFAKWDSNHVKRDKNQEADRLSKLALK